MNDEDVPLGKVGHPHQTKDYDLSGRACDVRRTGKAPPLENIRSDYRTPAQMMRALGFDPSKHMDPMQFMMAVLNDRVDLIYTRKKPLARAEENGISISYRLECAKVMAKYMYMEMPKLSLQQNETVERFSDELASRIASGDVRVRSKRLIIETVEAVSPDMDVGKANYPPHLQNVLEARLIEKEDGSEDGEGTENDLE